MTRWLRGLTGLGLLLGVVAVSAYGGWRWGDRVVRIVGEWRASAETAGEAGPEPGPELAERTAGRVDAFRRDGASGDEELALGSAEVASVVRFAAPGMLPAGVIRPRVELDGGRVRISSRVVVADVPPVPELERIVGILPDTLPVSLEASLMPFGEEGAALVVHGMSAGGIPLPRRLVPRVLAALGRKDRPGLPPEAISVPLPEGLRSAYILSDSLVLVAARE